MAVKADTPLIALSGIRRSYGGGEQPLVEVLHGIDLAIHAGEFVAIVGASGSGKSTLMHILGCLDRPTAGTYRFAGHDVADLDADQLAWLRREAFGFVFQGYHLIPTESAAENVAVPAIYAGMGEDERKARAAELLTRLGLHDKQTNRPKQLSGGQQQRVSIARALMNGGRIILADEPTGALDTRSGAEVMALFDELADAGHTIILITHDRDVAARARRVIEISDGNILSDSGRAQTAEALPPPDFADADRQALPLLATLQEAVRTAWRVLGASRFRTALTLLGIIIGVASVIVMMGVGEGARNKVMAEMGAMGATIMYLGGKTPEGGGPRGQISLEDLAAVNTLPEISRVMPAIGDPVTMRYGNVGEEVYALGSTDTLPAIHRWGVSSGRFHNAEDDRALAPVVVLGVKVKEKFFRHIPDPIGRQVLIGSTPFQVIGVMTEKGAESGSSDYDEMVFIPYRSALARVYRTEWPDYTVIEAVSSDVATEAEAAVHKLLLARHGREDFSIGNAAARLNAEMETRRSMTLMLALIAAVSLIVGGIGVMNVMLMTVKERTREIGIRMATGARQSDILRQFMTEAVLVSVIGGLAGIALGGLISTILWLSDIPIGLSLPAVLGAFGCAVAAGLLFGFLPARTAARLDPVQALAGE